jgi:hypothetical protein
MVTKTFSSKLRQVIKDHLLENGVYIASSTPYPSLVSFLSSLKPVETNHELIRVGGDGDGGYLIPNDLTGIDACFSPGVAATSDFENDLAARGVRCFLADFSVDGPPVDNPLFDFEKKYIGVDDDETFITLVVPDDSITH